VSVEDIEAEDIAEYQETYEDQILADVKMHLILEDICRREKLQLTKEEETFVEEQLDEMLGQFEQQWRQQQKLQLKANPNHKENKPDIDKSKVR